MMYYQLAVFLLIIFFVFLSKIKSGSFINPVLIFSFFWGGSILLSSFDLADIIMPSMRTYYYLLLAFVMYSLGSLTFLNKVNRQEVIKMKFKTPFLMHCLFYFQIIVMVILLYFIRKGLAMIATMGPGGYRGLVYDTSGVFGSFRMYIEYLVQPAIYLFVIISVSGFFLKVLPKKNLFLAVLNIMLYSIATLGRMPFLLLFFSFIFGFLYLNSVANLKLTKKYLILILLPVVLILTMSVFRQNKNTGSVVDIIWNYFIWYFTGNFTMFDYFLNNYTAGIDYDYSYFRAFSAGIENFFSPLSNKIIPNYYEINKSLHEITKVFRNAGGGKAHNSNYSMLYAFYRDAGVIGVAFYSYVIGVINSWVYNAFSKKITLFNLSTLLFFTYMMIFCVLRWNFRYKWFWIVMIGLILVLKRYVIKPTNQSMELSDNRRK